MSVKFIAAGLVLAAAVSVPVITAASLDESPQASFPSAACEQAEIAQAKAWNRYVEKYGRMPHGPYVPLAACAK